MKIKVIDRSGNNSEIPAEVGMSIESAITQAGVEDSFGICGGACACATCHVYVDESWVAKLPQKEDGEEDMLDFAFEVKESSRLSCQITVDDTLDGLVVSIPEKQF